MNIKADDIAVIGMAGRFPGANNVSEFWENICEKKDSIRSLSDEELRSAGVSEQDIADSSYVRASAPLDDVDMFDPGFFKISPLEAELMDPQIRLLLQCAWETLEDAGYAKKEAQNIGVFAGAGGVTTSYFANFVNVNGHFERVTASPTHLGNDKDFLATYISYKLNLTGPSLTVQTACSTSLVALHQARLSLLNGECDMALAGGVTIRVPHAHGYRYKEGYIFSKSGHIKAFDEGADGVVFGSGLGLVLLKKLSDAIRDGDNIYAVVKGTAIRNDGKGKMSYAASSAKGQIACVRAALKNAGVDAESIGFVESHGTGTSMGDPEEVKALSAAFKEQTDKKQYCALGAVKANVGHLEAAAGITGFIKAVLTVKHGLIPPVAHYTKPNARIKFESTPFYVNSTLQKWTAGKGRRRAAVNSLGVGGTNAFAIVEEHAAQKPAKRKASRPVVIPLSAKTEESLRAGAERLANFLAVAVTTKSAPSIADVAYTLQTGREAMDCRAAFVASKHEELVAALRKYLEGAEAMPAQGEAAELAAAWVALGEVDWMKLYPGASPQRVSLPTYAFAKERFWIEAGSAVSARAVIHPLLHANTSDLNEQKYSSTFTGDEFFLSDHQVRVKRRTQSRTQGDSPSSASLQKLLPAVAYLEMARVAIEQAAPNRYDASVLELRDVTWMRPIAVSQSKQVNIAVIPRGAGDEPNERIDFEVYTEDDHIHCQGSCVFTSKTDFQRLDPVQLKASMRRGTVSAGEVYAAFKKMGLSFGPAHRAIATVQRGDQELLAHLVLPPSVETGHRDYVLHPSLIDGALQAATGLLFDPNNVPSHPVVPFALGSMRLLAPCAAEMYAWARYAPGSQTNDKSAQLDIELFDANGNVCVQMRGFTARALGRETLGSLLATQQWQINQTLSEAAVHAEQHVILCDLPQVDASRIARDCSVVQLEGGKSIAERYDDLALACFEKAQALLNSRPQSRKLIQLVLPNTDEHAVYAGLAGFFRTVRLENPQVAGQVILVEGGIGTDRLTPLLHADSGRSHDSVIKYERDSRHVATWRFLTDEDGIAFSTDGPFKDGGVYLITGGLGGLGVLFANEILARTPSAKVILTGRASASEVQKSRHKKAILESLQTGGAGVEYRQVDLTDLKQVEELIGAVRTKHQQLNGIIHSAGMTADGFLLKKTAEEFRGVLGPKTVGTCYLDQATRHVGLDFFVLFSSLTSAVGNLGQADYAAANGFLDTFSAYRNRLVKAGERQGATVAIRWPLWRDGGMQLDGAGRDMLHQATGIHPMQTATGMRMFYRSLALGIDQTLVMEGDLNVMQRALGIGEVLHAAPTEVGEPGVESSLEAEGGLADLTERYLCRQFATLLKLPAHKVDAHVPLEDYGIDSILALDLTTLLEKTFGALPKTLFFEYLTIHQLGAYFVGAHRQTLSKLFALGDTAVAHMPAQAPGNAQPQSNSSIRSRQSRFGDEASGSAQRQPHAATEPIAIVGLSGRYPESRDLQAFWRNLRDGRDCIVEVPNSRWDWRDYYSEDRAAKGRHYSKWGGFIEGVDEFDARFFNVSPLEAETIDPQERLFLQHAWMAIEDAGYTRAALQMPQENDLPGQVGVYAGVMYGEYQLFGAEASLQGNRMGFASNLASIANRVSYALNLHGPSMAVDTMCSSSLTAIHLACQDLRLGHTSLGIAGGVNVTIHPNKYLMLSAGQFISGDGHCQSFGEGGDGYIPGEGVGVVVLKRLSEAQRDGNHIYGVIRGSALSHGGKTNGYTVPNPQAQARAIRQALAEAKVDPRHVSYIEAHGTGTKLGDPIEIAALARVFRESTQDSGFCLIGSAKSNIGHAEAAAGIAGLTKVLLQMKHRQIVPSLHSSKLNPHIDFENTPFVVNQTLKPWHQPVVDGRTLPRIAGISSFGAGGSNAHLIVEEYPEAATPAHGTSGEHIVPLSARTADQLQQKARDLLDFLRGATEPLPLSSVAYTFQTGREPMDERLAVLADSTTSLADKLGRYLDGQDVDGLYLGQVKANKDTLSLLTQDPDLRGTVAKWIAGKQHAKLAELWAKGLELDWQKFYTTKPALLGLPTYPFAKQRFWLDAAAPVRRAGKALTADALHPLLHRNTSSFEQQSYATTLHVDEFFVAGEAGQRRLAEAAYLEMARAAIESSMPSHGEARMLELRDVAWAQPGAVIDGKPITTALFDKIDDGVTFEIYTAESEIVHCQGHAVYSQLPAPAKLDLPAIAAQDGKLLIELSLPTELPNDQNVYILHPALVQNALQAAAALTGGASRPFMMASVRIAAASTKAKFAWLRQSASADRAIDIDLCDEHGNVCTQMHGVRYRAAVSPAVQASAEEAPNRTVALGETAGARTVEPQPIKANRIRFEEPRTFVSRDAIRAKPRDIVLRAPDFSANASNGFTASRKPTVLLAAIGSGAEALAAPHAASPVALFDHGNGVFAIRVDGRADGNVLSTGVIEDLVRAMRTVAEAPSAKVLTVEGTDHHFFSGGLAQHRAAISAGLYRAISEFPYPVIAVARGDAIGSGFLVAALSDFMVCSDSARYAFSVSEDGLYPSAAEEELLAERFGRVHATDFLYFSDGGTGAELRAKGWTCPVLPSDQVSRHAQDLAGNLAQKSQKALKLLKQHLGRRIVEAAGALPAATDVAFVADESLQVEIHAPSDRLKLTMQGNRVLIVTIGAQGEAFSAQELLADLKVVCGQIEEASAIRCVVLASELPEFLPGVHEDDCMKVAQGYRDAVRALRRPVVAALNGDAQGIAWCIAQFCDACVYSDEGRYSCADTLRHAPLAAEAAAAFAWRFGDEAAKQLLLTGGEASGAELRRDYGVLHVVRADQVLAQALVVADALAALPMPVLSAWKQRVATALETVKLLGDERTTTEEGARHEIALESKVISAIAHPEGILEVRMADRDAKNMFSDAFSRGMREVFTHVEQNGAHKVVVLTGYDNYFASGGTQDTLLAIQEGRAKFTDNAVFQLPLACPVPVVAAMQGHGIGAGWALGMYADFTLFSDESRYTSPYMGYGFTPGAGSTLLFPEKIGYDLARETLLTAREYSGGELKERGLRNAVLPREEVLPAAMALARRIAQSTRGQLVTLKRHWTGALRDALRDTFDRELAMHERTFVGQAETLARIQGRFGAEAAPAKQAVALSEPLPQHAPVHDLGAITAGLRRMLAHELRMQEHEIDLDEQFVDLGLDSITGVTWVRRINETYGTSIEAIKVYSYPTLNKLARFVREETPNAATLVASAAVPATSPARAPALVPSSVACAVEDVSATAATLRALLAHELRMQEQEVGDDEQFVDLGLDSITGVTWIRRINEMYGTSIEAIKVYSYPTLRQLSQYVRDEAQKAGAFVAAPQAQAEADAQTSSPAQPNALALTSWRTQSKAKSVATRPAIGLQPIAVIGMAGQFAKARNLEEFWQNIAGSRDCIDEVPQDRWDIGRYYQAGEVAPGKTYSKWMGTLDEYDLFDAAFFSISPREAKSMDPQQRLFLQACWHAVEHAGYDRKALAGSRCGVFVGCSAGDYHQLSRREQLSGQGFTGAAPSILAARISYFMDLQGPSLSIDTACSSSLVAIATACDSLVSGASDIALAGGVNVMAGPAMQIMTAQVGMLSPQGRCFTFDERANGIANGEGAGVVMLKRLADAERDRDCIHGVVEGWGVNQDGTTNGITAPNADSQARLQQEVYDRFHIDPGGIQLIEAHGTGTALGDPIEVAGLKTSFAKYTRTANYCALGSVKSNIGHCLTAAGVSGFLKVLLALKHEQLPPTIHFNKLNKHISLNGSPFYINDRLQAWPRNGAQARRAAVNSFGFSGTNAHVVIAEYRGEQANAVRSGPTIVPISARTASQLERKAQDLLAFLRSHDTAQLDLHRIAHTLQVGREAMNERIALVASTVGELEDKLQGLIDQKPVAGVYRGQAGSGDQSTLLGLSSDPDFQVMVGKWIAKKELSRLADLWAKGLALDWTAFYTNAVAPRRMGLPLYPFAKERHWIDVAPEEDMSDRSAAHARLAEIDLSEPDGTLGLQLEARALEAAPHSVHALPQPKVSLAPLIVPSSVPHDTEPPASVAKSSTTPRISLAQLQSELKTSLAEALFMKTSDVDVRKSFTELGLDSIVGVEWIRAVNKQYGTGISATRVYDYPTVTELAAFLHPQMAALKIEVATPAAAPAPLRQPAQLAAATPRISRETLQQQLKSSLAEALYMQPGDVDVNKSFTELGLDSIIGVEWVKSINKQYGTGISATRVYDYPSVKELAAHLAAEMVAEIPQTTVPAPVAAALSVSHELGTETWADARSTHTSRAGAILTSRSQGTGGIRFEPDYAPKFKSLYFYSADSEGDFENEGEFSIRCTISPETNVCLKEHVVFGEHLLPTDAYVELVYSAYRTYFSAADVHLRNVAIANPMLGTKGKDTHVKVVFRRAGDDLQFFVKSSVSPDFSNDKLHMQGFIAVASGAAPSRYDASFAVQRTLAHGEIPTNSGVYYSPLQSLRFGESSALGSIRVADHGFDFLANPFALYGGLCTVINYARHLANREYGASSEPSDQFLPYRIGQIAVFDAPGAGDYRCYAELRALERDSMEFYFEIVDLAGRPVAIVDSIVLRRVAQKAIRQQPSAGAGERPVVETVRPSGTGARPEKVAIIGMSCRYPMSANIDAFWENLKAGRDCVTEVPADRWSAYPDWYHPDPRHPHTSYSKWGGFLDNIDQFDALFFGISPAEAELMDPQQRIFLEECWKTIESAGYAPSALSNRSCGVYVGCSTGDYVRVLAGDGQDTAGAAFMGTSNAILAARISYYLNLKGPALAVDTACSSSLVAVHLACESIRSGENELALAGGINLLATPIGHILTSQVGMPSRDGRCAAFDASANGIVFSEGCGVLLLKALSAAQRDNDDILGVIQGSGINQDGKTNGITAPSSNAQERLLRQVYEKFDIDPARIGYVEAHGTATPLGDPIEVNALTAVFGKATNKRNTCALGSVKSNIGHTGFAAGVAGIVKVLLCIKHRKLVPSIHYHQPNPHIDFARSPFYVNTDYREWYMDGPRLATVSSFGFSGTNAHVVIEEHLQVDEPVHPECAKTHKVFIPLSAKTAEQLHQRVADLLDFIRKQELPVDLARMGHTLQVGRDAMDHRLALIVASAAELASKLEASLDDKARCEDVYRGQASRGDDTLAMFAADEEMRQVMERWIAQKNLPKLADLWVKGFELDFNALYDAARPRRMSLPTYPFAKERCWVERPARAKSVGAASATRANAEAIAVLHPLLHRNTSDLSQQSYSSVFGGDEFFLADHRVKGQKVLPAVAHLEMARAALREAMPAKSPQHLELRHVAWVQPIIASGEKTVGISVFAEGRDQLGFEIYSKDEGGDEVLHCQGSCLTGEQPEVQMLDLAGLRTRLQRPTLEGGALYETFATMGLQYGPAFQGIVAVHQSDDELLVELKLPPAVQRSAGDYQLHPSLMDSALQGSIVLINNVVEATGKPVLPFALESLRILSPCTERMAAWVRYSHGARNSTPGLIKVDIDLCDASGKVCVQMHGFSSRAMEDVAAFDEVHYESIMARILSNEISVDEAVELG
jgi:acyl transferase domain-containing protein/enoyl-CoA hydratase/carnithine racemase